MAVQAGFWIRIITDADRFQHDMCDKAEKLGHHRRQCQVKQVIAAMAISLQLPQLPQIHFSERVRMIGTSDFTSRASQTDDLSAPSIGGFRRTDRNM